MKFKEYQIIILGIIVTYLLSFFLKVAGLSVFDSIFSYLVPFSAFILTYYAFKEFDKISSFDLSKNYVFLILAFLLFFSFYIAFYVYWKAKINVPFKEFISKSGINWLSYMFSTPYAFFIVAVLIAWLSYKVYKR